MIEVHPGAERYFARLIEQQDAGPLALRIAVSDPGTPAAQCQLTFCEPEGIAAEDARVACEGFDLIVDAGSIEWLDAAELDFEEDAVGGQLVVKAPNIRGSVPGDDAPLRERVQYLLDAEINPSVAAHGGHVTLVEVTEQREVLLRFGGGCHGCGMASVTLKEGIEKTLLRELPEITAVRDATDHSTGENPYYA